MRLTSSKHGLRTIALVEGAKGVLVLALGLSLLSLLHRDVEQLAEQLIRLTHLNPARHCCQIFIQTASVVSNRFLWMLAMAAFLYACLRFAEAYGLWHMRAWAAWLGVITGSVYLPIEVYQLFHRVTAFRIGLLCVNLIVVGYLILGLVSATPPTTLSEA